MKKIRLALLLACMSFLIQAQTNRKVNFSTQDQQLTRVGLTIGGVAFTAAGFLTPPIYTNVHQQGLYVKQVQLPIYQQGPRLTCMVTGITLTLTGLISLIAK